ncbi:MAG: DUF3343 domain-containing protein [Oscillospiraceae bacterium]|nr:DUF3343 domain-containing protein [Oscillospiraceae bacterium]MBQ2231428.1 DUF3343 domain-containing protein [Oscillospiraceae bacterium]MBQ2330608.1 DUF3343 domain-containing protein [Oscillospiraceae bacterium]MBQ3952498.1 DUF3343 domain-containing protein [Oscillospiraceae bacterium]MBQ5514203.1 DUF3343 domain-containing protein [Oscillospiraceae bacterium]
MFDILIVCRTLTSAQRVSRLLSARGWRAMVIRTPPSVWREGCGWSVKVLKASPQPVIDELERARLTQNRIYRLEGGLPVEEVRP